MSYDLKDATVLIVDDVPENIDVLTSILKKDYNIKAANNGLVALKVAMESLPDLILLDVMMPGMDGFQTCRRLKELPATKNIPVLFVTTLDEVKNETVAFEHGAVDYITKPVNPEVVKARVRTHLALYNQNKILEQQVKERTKEVSLVQDVTIFCLATLAETRDNETGAHILRTQNYVRVLAEFLAKKDEFKSELTPEVIDLLFKSAPLHDIGKVGIADCILLKPGRLTFSEFEIMKNHTKMGYEAIRKAEEQLGVDVESSFLRYAREITRWHHERWDGSGYPDGLSGEKIPLSARLMSVADVYDALISKRVYKEAIPHKEAVAIICSEIGTQFDPNVIEAFIELQGEFRNIARIYSDTNF